MSIAKWTAASMHACTADSADSAGGGAFAGAPSRHQPALYNSATLWSVPPADSSHAKFQGKRHSRPPLPACSQSTLAAPLAPHLANCDQVALGIVLNRQGAALGQHVARAGRSGLQGWHGTEGRAGVWGEGTSVGVRHHMVNTDWVASDKSRLQQLGKCSWSSQGRAAADQIKWQLGVAGLVEGCQLFELSLKLSSC